MLYIVSRRLYSVFPGSGLRFAQVAGRLRKTKEKTMAAFKKAFELDLQLDQSRLGHKAVFWAWK